MMDWLNAINWHACFFYLFAAIACGFAVAVVVSGNVVRMAFYLIVSLGAVAALFFLAGADFVGAMQLMIYVGGTLVLLAFGVMLTARGPLVSLPTGGGQWLLAAVVGVPEPIIKKLEAVFKKARKDPTFIEEMGKLRVEISHLSGKEYLDLWRKEYHEMGKVIKILGIGEK